MLWLEVVIDQLVNNVVSVLVDKLQADGLQVGTNVVTDLSQKLGHGLESKMRKINKMKFVGLLLLLLLLADNPFTCSLFGSTILSSRAVITVSQMVHVTKLPWNTF